MPAQSEFGDASTMIDGPTGSYGYTSTSAAYIHAQAHAASGRAKGAESANARGTMSTFARMPDYFSEERPYVVHIGKKGVLGALEELDEHLRTVRSRLAYRWEKKLTNGVARVDITRYFRIRSVCDVL